MNKSSYLEINPKPCVGCGFCCLKAKCSAGQRLYPTSEICNALLWSDEKNRYICNLTTLPGILGEDYRKELYIGEGCCCNLNSWRSDVKNRNKIEIEIVSLNNIFQIFLKALSSEPTIGSDKLYLVLSNFKHYLEKGNIKNYDKIVDLVKRNINNNRNKMFKSFID